MKLALFGGTFDPIHMGHLLVAEAARQEAKLDRVIFLPTFHPPHKKDVHASPKDRLAMVRLAVAGQPAFRVSDWEIRQGRTVYTIDALAHFSAGARRDQLFFIVGSDSLRDIRSWRGGVSLLDRATFLIVERQDAPWSRIAPALRRKTRRIPCAHLPFASHEIREAMSRGRSVRYQVPESVERYLRRRAIYAKAS